MLTLIRRPRTKTLLASRGFALNPLDLAGATFSDPRYRLAKLRPPSKPQVLHSVTPMLFTIWAVNPSVKEFENRFKNWKSYCHQCGVFLFQSHEDTAAIEVVTDVAMATIFWLSVHGVHIGATWRIQLNRPCGGDAALCQMTLTTC